MSEAPAETAVAAPEIVCRRPWVLPRLAELPKLTKLTLASAIGGGGSTGGSGSTVFGILLALVALAGCSADRSGEPSAPVAPVGQLVTCRATVATGAIDCSGPAAIPGIPEIFGRQGGDVALRSTNVSYDGSNIFQADVSVQNLTVQTIGTTGANNLGFNVFFESGPDISTGSGLVLEVANPDGTDGTFDGSNQAYFHYVDSLAPGQTSPARNWQWAVSPTITSFTFTVRVAAEVPDLGGVELWEEVPFFNGTGFTDIAVNSATDAMAVGPNGVVMRKTGSVWRRLPIQIAEDWVGVEAIGGGKYIGATAEGTVARFDKDVWRVITHVPFGIETLSAYGDSNLVVGGLDSLYWRGSNFSNLVQVGTGNPWSESAIYNGGSAFVVSAGGAVRWGVFSSTATNTFGASFINALAGTPASSFPIAGRGTNVVDPTINTSYGQPDGSQVTAVTFGTGSVGSDFWAATFNGVNASVLSHAAGAWYLRGTFGPEVIQMVDDSAGGIYLLSADGIRRWNGTTIVDEVIAPGSETPTAVSALGSDVFVGMSGGTIWHRDGAGSWSSAPAGPNEIRDIGVFGGSAAVAYAATGEFYIWNGSAWAFFVGAPVTGPAPRAIAFNATQFASVSNLGPPVGGSIFTFNGVTPSLYLDPAGKPTLYDVWGTDIHHVWAVGADGRIARSDGPVGQEVLNPATDTLWSITGTSDTDVWFGGKAGYLQHWDGSAWTICTVGTGNITTLWASGIGTVYVGAGTGKVYRVDSNCNKRAVTLPGATSTISAFGGYSADALWAIAGPRVYYGHR